MNRRTRPERRSSDAHRAVRRAEREGGSIGAEGPGLVTHRIAPHHAQRPRVDLPCLVVVGACHEDAPSVGRREQPECADATDLQRASLDLARPSRRPVAARSVARWVLDHDQVAAVGQKRDAGDGEDGPIGNGGNTMRDRRSWVRGSIRSTSAPGGSSGGSWPVTASVLPSGEKVSVCTSPPPLTSPSWYSPSGSAARCVEDRHGAGGVADRQQASVGAGRHRVDLASSGAVRGRRARRGAAKQRREQAGAGGDRVVEGDAGAREPQRLIEALLGEGLGAEALRRRRRWPRCARPGARRSRSPRRRRRRRAARRPRRAASAGGGWRGAGARPRARSRPGSRRGTRARARSARGRARRPSRAPRRAGRRGRARRGRARSRATRAAAPIRCW